MTVPHAVQACRTFASGRLIWWVDDSLSSFVIIWADTAGDVAASAWEAAHRWHNFAGSWGWTTMVGCAGDLGWQAEVLRCLFALTLLLWYEVPPD